MCHNCGDDEHEVEAIQIMAMEPCDPSVYPEHVEFIDHGDDLTKLPCKSCGQLCWLSERLEVFYQEKPEEFTLLCHPCAIRVHAAWELMGVNFNQIGV